MGGRHQMETRTGEKSDSTPTPKTPTNNQHPAKPSTSKSTPKAPSNNMQTGKKSGSTSTSKAPANNQQPLKPSTSTSKAPGNNQQPLKPSTSKPTPKTPSSNKHLEECGTCNKPGLKPDESIKCDFCCSRHHFTCIDVCVKQLISFVDAVGADMSKSGFRWFCAGCRSKFEEMKISANEQGNSKTNENLSMTLEIRNMKAEMLDFQQKVNDNLESLQKSLISNKPCSWADIVTNGENETPDLVQKIAKEVTDVQKKLTLERENRENNVIMFNAKESDTSDSDIDFFNSMCSETLEFDEVPEVEMARLGEKQEKYERPIKVIFKDNWAKRKFLSKLYKLKSDERFTDVRIAHDMSVDDRKLNKKLLDEAYLKNQQDKSTEYRWKVRGPPWSLKIVKVFSKNFKPNK